MQQTSTSQLMALVDTQRKMLQGKFGERYRHPFYWAPYFIVGDGRGN